MAVIDELFPVHFVTDGLLRVCSVGPRVSSVAPELQIGDKLSEHFALRKPDLPFDGTEPAQLIGRLCRLQAAHGPLSLRVQVTELEPDRFLFACSISVARVAELEAVGVDLADFAPHDPTLDLVFLLRAQETALEDARRLARRLADQRRDLRDSNRRIAAQYAFTRALADTAQASSVWSRVVGAVGSALACRAVTAWRCTDQRLDRVAAWDGSLIADSTVSVPLGCGFLGQAALTSEAQWAEAFITIDGEHLLDRVGDCYAIGVTYQGKLHGLIALHNPRSDNHGDILYLLGDLGVKLSQFLEHQAATEKVALQARELEQARDAALESVRAKSSFVATISHEIRTPLNAVIGMTSLLLGEDLSSAQRGKIDVIHTASETLLNLVNDVLDFSRSESRRMVLEQTAIDPDQLVGEIVRQHQAAATVRGIDFGSEIDPDLSTLTGDPLRLKQILGNLVSNAIKFTDAGSVTVRVAAAPGARIRFEVVDTGMGIAEGDQARLFQPFSQIDSSTTRRYGGTGLGLAISRQLVERMGGEISCDSEPGQGSRFWFSVPAGGSPHASHADPAVPTVPAVVEPIGPSARPRIEQLIARPSRGIVASPSVLITEDSAVNQTVLRMMLDQLGVAADVCAHGIEAIERVASGNYQLVFMDYHMPEMDGLEATRRIRAAGHHSLTIIGCTASTMPEETERCLAAGMNDVLEKPILPQHLARVIDLYLPCPGRPAEVAGEPDPCDTVVDAKRLEMLGRLGNGSGDVRDQLFCSFLNEAPGRARALLRAVQAGPVSEVAAAAHALKGMAGNLGAIELAAHCASIEAEARASQVAVDRIKQLPRILRRAVTHLEQSTRPPIHHETRSV